MLWGSGTRLTAIAVSVQPWIVEDVGGFANALVQRWGHSMRGVMWGAQGVLTLMERNSSAVAAYTDAEMVVRARLVVVSRPNVRGALPHGLVRQQRENKGALEIVAAVIAVMNLKEHEQRWGEGMGNLRAT